MCVRFSLLMLFLYCCVLLILRMFARIIQLYSHIKTNICALLCLLIFPEHRSKQSLTKTQNFHNRAITKVQKVGERYRKMDEAYKDACNMYGENSRTKEPGEFFQVFIDFVNQYKVCFCCF